MEEQVYYHEGQCSSPFKGFLSHGVTYSPRRSGVEDGTSIHCYRPMKMGKVYFSTNTVCFPTIFPSESQWFGCAPLGRREPVWRKGVTGEAAVLWRGMWLGGGNVETSSFQEVIRQSPGRRDSVCQPRSGPGSGALCQGTPTLFSKLLSLLASLWGLHDLTSLRISLGCKLDHNRQSPES